MKNFKRGARGLAFGIMVAVATVLLLPSAGQASSSMAWAPANPPGASADGSGLPPGADAPRTAQNGKTVPYIVGGNETTFDKHPWLVQITLNGGAHCGGALVHPMLVLTAAHCVWSGNDNDWWGNLAPMQAFTSRTITQTGGEELQIAGWSKAQNYSPLPGTGENDYGFLALASPSARPTLQIAGADERATWRAGRMALVAGFGNIQQGGPASTVLKEINEPIIDDAVCGSPGSYGTQFFVANMVCAGIMQGAAGTCQGDSGGPLSVPLDGGGRRIVGVVSWGDGCAKPNKPTVFARVAEAGMSTQVNAAAKGAAQFFNFPGQYADPNVVGAGGKPAGCSAAQGAAAQAQAALGTANRNLAKAKKGVASAKKGVAKAKKAVRKANRKRKARAKRGLRSANAKLKKANAKLKKAKSSVSRAKANLAAANGQAGAACN